MHCAIISQVDSKSLCKKLGEYHKRLCRSRCASRSPMPREINSEGRAHSEKMSIIVLFRAFMLFLALVRRYHGYHQIRVIVSTEMNRMRSRIHGVVVPEQVIVRHFP